MEPICNSKLSTEIRAYVKRGYDLFTDLVDCEIFLLTRNLVRKKFKRTDGGGNLLIAYVDLGNKYFKPKIQFRFKARRHDYSDTCSCYNCELYRDCFNIDDPGFMVEYYVEIFAIYDANHPDGVFRKFVDFELTTNLNKIHDKIRRDDFANAIMNFFETYYPFDRCISCKFEYAKIENMCHNCAVSAMQYNSNGDKCCICLDPEIKMVCCKLPCGHIFHKLCYDRYSAGGVGKIEENTILPFASKCPLCKAETKEYLIL